jgi:DNA-binding GntR family transcriptional regulator
MLSAPVDPLDRERVLTWHERIVEAIAAGDADAAAAAMTEVIHNGLRRHEAGAANRPQGDTAPEKVAR